ncbi:MAG TPA: HAMP domain-containing methyl-accepting chemotaxis protein [Kofleriaceae bacterium]|nr:HAMP domain-containing methyl-accepting chemotaxis protein [Kofleriaceae bacterium]
MPRTPLLRILPAIGAVDALFSALLAYTFAAMMGLEGSSRGVAFGVYAVMWVVKVSVWMAIVAVRMQPLSEWVAQAQPPTDAATLGEVTATVYRAPFMVCAAYSFALLIFYITYAVVLYVGFSDSVPLGPSSLTASVLAGVGITLGAVDLSFPLCEWLLAPFVERVSLTAQEHNVPARGGGMSYRARLVAFALTLALAPTFYLSSITYMNDARTEQRELVLRAELVAAHAAFGQDVGERLRGGSLFSYDAVGNVTDSEVADLLADRPELRRRFETAVRRLPSGTVEHPREGVIAFRTDGERKTGAIVPRAPSVSFGTTLVIILFLLIVSLWGPLSALFIANSTAVSVVRIADALAHVGEGEVASAPKVAVFHQDEVGSLARNYNIMIDQLRLLAQRTNEVSKGALDVEFDILRGDLGDAFRGQVTSLREMVSHIAHSASQLAGAASEMYAAAQEQEAAAQQQSAGVEEVARTMESLLVAATHVTESTMGVLTRAERTRETTSRTSERITELSAHANRIAEILDVIRDIADRSDLLALNASLEGTRAGEAGRGFALVAGEMRKLAERVTGSVSDIKKLVSDVRASVSATVLATEESSTLAAGTTESARQINLVTQQQRSGTEQAGQSMRDVATMITQSLAATRQVRSLAEDLKVQAENLNAVVARFRLPARQPGADG